MVTGWAVPFLALPIHTIFPHFARKWLPATTRWSIFDRVTGGDLAFICARIEHTLAKADPVTHLHTKDGLNEAGFGLLFVQALGTPIDLEVPLAGGYADAVIINDATCEALVIEFKYVRFGFLGERDGGPFVPPAQSQARRTRAAQSSLTYFTARKLSVSEITCRTYNGDTVTLDAYRYAALAQATRYATALARDRPTYTIRSAAVVGYGPRVTWTCTA